MPSRLDIGGVPGGARYAFDGLRSAVKHERAFRQELALGAVIAPAAVWLGDDGLQRAVLLGSLVLVLIVELLNSAIETVVDRIGAERNQLSAQAKDLASAAVLLLSLVNVPVGWGFVLLG